MTTALYADATCESFLANTGAVGQCTAQPGVQAAIATASPTGPSSCAPGGGSPTGSVTAQPALTICCPP